MAEKVLVCHLDAKRSLLAYFSSLFLCQVLPVASNMYTEMSMAMKVPTNKYIIVSSVVQCVEKLQFSPLISKLNNSYAVF